MTYIDQITSIALQNKYTKWYCFIIERAQFRSSTRKAAKALFGYVEKHHILPKSFKLGGEKDNLNYAYLTAKEHFMCHKLLSKMFIDSYKRKMLRAYRAMAILIAPNQQRYKINSREFDKLRKFGGFAGEKHRPESIKLMCINANGFKKGYTPWNKGVPTPDNIKQKQTTGGEQYRKKKSKLDKSAQGSKENR
jgi:hypothetical protein